MTNILIKLFTEEKPLEDVSIQNNLGSKQNNNKIFTAALGMLISLAITEFFPSVSISFASSFKFVYVIIAGVALYFILKMKDVVTFFIIYTILVLVLRDVLSNTVLLLLIGPGGF